MADPWITSGRVEVREEHTGPDGTPVTWIKEEEILPEREERQVWFRSRSDEDTDDA